MKQTWIILEKEMETCTYHGDFFTICTRTSAIYLEVCICTLTQAKVLLTSLETYNKHFASDNKVIQDFRKYHHDSSYKYACRIPSDVLIMPCIKLDCVLKLLPFCMFILSFFSCWSRQQGETESLQSWLLHRWNVLFSYVLTWLPYAGHHC